MVPKIIKRWNGSAWVPVVARHADPAFVKAPTKVRDYLVEELFTTSGSWTCPDGITEVQVECWGAGGGGGGRSGSPGGVGGGGGGAYARKIIAVTPGNIYNFTIGAAGTAGASSGGNGGDGGDTYWDAGIDVLAEGGKGGLGISGGTAGAIWAGGSGGLAANSIGSTKFNGGDGGAGRQGGGGQGQGAGGGAAGSIESGGIGGNGISTSVIPLPGIGGEQYGGDGGEYSTSRDGNLYGGGGGGARRITGSAAGGAGAAGLIRIRLYTEFTPQYQAVLDRAAVLGYPIPSRAQQFFQNQVMYRLISSGILALVDAFWMPNNDSSLIDFGRINWKNPATHLATPVNNPTHLGNGGMQGNGTNSYMLLNWAPNPHGVNWTLNDASFGVYVGTEAALANQVDLGGQNSGSHSNLFLSRRNDNLVVATINSINALAAANTTGKGLWHIKRTSSTSVSVYRNGALVATQSVTSTGLSTSNIALGGLWLLSFLNQPSTRVVGMCWVGASLTGLEATMYNIWNEYKTAIRLFT